MFPVNGFLPSHAFSILSLVLFAVILVARYRFHLAGAWRWIFVASLLLTVYLDAFVALFQAFLKIPSLHPLAPNGSEPPFAIAQGILLVLLSTFGVIASRSYHPGPGWHDGRTRFLARRRRKRRRASKLTTTKQTLGA